MATEGPLSFVRVFNAYMLRPMSSLLRISGGDDSARQSFTKAGGGSAQDFSAQFYWKLCPADVPPMWQVWDSSTNDLGQCFEMVGLPALLLAILVVIAFPVVFLRRHGSRVSSAETTRIGESREVESSASVSVPLTAERDNCIAGAIDAAKQLNAKRCMICILGVFFPLAVDVFSPRGPEASIQRTQAFLLACFCTLLWGILRMSMKRSKAAARAIISRDTPDGDLVAASKAASIAAHIPLVLRILLLLQITAAIAASQSAVRLVYREAKGHKLTLESVLWTIFQLLNLFLFLHLCVLLFRRPSRKVIEAGT